MFHYSKYKQWPAVWTCNLMKRVNWFQWSGQFFAMISTGPGSRSRYSTNTHNFLSTGDVTTQAQQYFGLLRGNRSINISYREIPISQTLDFWNLQSSPRTPSSPPYIGAWVPRTKSSFPSVWFTLVHSNSWFLEPIIICLGVWGNPGISGDGIPEIFINTFS